MKQAVMTSPGKIEFRTLEKPMIKDTEVIIEVKRIGVCGSDIHVFHGLHPYTSYPVVQGHEVSGVIAEKGEKVRNLSIGQKVIFMPQMTCGICYPCTHGMYHICDSLKVMGFQTDGAAQTYFPIDAEKVLKIPDTVSLDEGAMIEPASVAVHAIRRGGGAEGKNILVLGAGTIGNLVAQVAQGTGANKVVITDINDFKLRKAQECGIERTINTTKESLPDAIKTHFGSNKADVILECVGVEDTITQAVNNARKGSTIVVVGVFGKKPAVDLGFVQDRELTLVGTLMYQQQDYEKAIELAGGRKLILDKMITNYFPFDQYLQAYQFIDQANDQTLKVMITLD
jgi:L-iditol 2-dehydrogenase